MLSFNCHDRPIKYKTTVATTQCEHILYYRLSQIKRDQLSFITCVSHTAHVIDRLDVCLSVCLFVRLSVTCWYCVETAQPIVKLSSLPGSSMILF